jgi:hypothetical protein
MFTLPFQNTPYLIGNLQRPFAARLTLEQTRHTLSLKPIENVTIALAGKAERSAGLHKPSPLHFSPSEHLVFNLGFVFSIKKRMALKLKDKSILET